MPLWALSSRMFLFPSEEEGGINPGQLPQEVLSFSKVVFENLL